MVTNILVASVAITLCLAVSNSAASNNKAIQEIVTELCKYFPKPTGICLMLPNGPIDPEIEAVRKYLGHGYNLAVANPVSNNDAGHTQDSTPVYKLTWHQQGGNLISQYTHSSTCTDSCSLTPTITVIESFGKYRAFLDHRVDSAQIGEVQEFTYRFIETDLNEADFSEGNKMLLIYFSCQIAVCSSVKAVTSPPVSRNFSSAVLTLPRSMPSKHQIKSRFDSFVKQFGTHVISSVKLGSFYGARVMFTAQQYEMIKMYSAEILGNAVLSRNKTILGNKAEYFEVGPKPQNLRAEEWLAASRRRPAPLVIGVKSLVSLLTPDKFPGVDVQTLEDRKATLQQFFDHKYCEASIHPDQPGKCSVSDSDNPVFGGIFQTSSCIEFKNVTNGLIHSDGMHECKPRYSPATFGKVKWTFADFPNANCLVTHRVCLLNGWDIKGKHMFGGIFIRKIQGCASESASAEEVQDCMARAVGAEAEVIETNLNPLRPRKSEHCPRNFKEYVFGKLFQWEYVMCLNEASVNNHGFFGGAFQKSDDKDVSRCVASGQTCIKVQQENPTTGLVSCDNGYAPLEIAHLGFASQHICIATG